MVPRIKPCLVALLISVGNRISLSKAEAISFSFRSVAGLHKIVSDIDEHYTVHPKTLERDPCRGPGDGVVVGSGLL